MSRYPSRKTITAPSASIAAARPASSALRSRDRSATIISSPISDEYPPMCADKISAVDFDPAFIRKIIFHAAHGRGRLIFRKSRRIVSSTGSRVPRRIIGPTHALAPRDLITLVSSCLPLAAVRYKLRPSVERSLALGQKFRALIDGGDTGDCSRKMVQEPVAHMRREAHTGQCGHARAAEIMKAPVVDRVAALRQRGIDAILDA